MAPSMTASSPDESKASGVSAVPANHSNPNNPTASRETSDHPELSSTVPASTAGGVPHRLSPPPIANINMGIKELPKMLVRRRLGPSPRRILGRRRHCSRRYLAFLIPVLQLASIYSIHRKWDYPKLNSLWVRVASKVPPTPVLPRCPLPQNTSAWRYYHALVDGNLRTSDVARNSTRRAPGPVERPAKREGRIPRRLIFTHKDNLLDCSKSSSNSTEPRLYTLAENVKATINAYREIWKENMQYVFLTDADCVDAVNRTEPSFIGWLDGSLPMLGMYKADICRAAYLLLHGGYYFDVDLLVVRPFVAPEAATFATVKGGEDFEHEGFFQAFLAAEKGNAIVRRSLKIMLEILRKERPQVKYLGPGALMAAWMEIENITKPLDAVNRNNGVYLLTEDQLGRSSTQKFANLSKVLASPDSF